MVLGPFAETKGPRRAGAKPRKKTSFGVPSRALSGFGVLVIMSRGRRTQVAKGAVCKTAIQRFDPARRLHFDFIL